MLLSRFEMVCRVKLSSVYRSIRFDVELGGSCMFIRRNPSLRVFAPEERRLKISSTHHLLAPEERHVYRSRQPATFLAPEERHVRICRRTCNLTKRWIRCLFHPVLNPICLCDAFGCSVNTLELMNNATNNGASTVSRIRLSP